ncbi:methionyl-tRNA formyltransferase [bacterium]|nr:methionyl-tRNA formyltransferase [bacterium]|tara:strand:- start:8967 stop:9827 length:861 start_codon:yes stop_codon:yes gene_type:complete
MSMPPYRVIFAGTPDIAVSSLQGLIDDPAFDVQLVITQPDKPVGRKRIIQEPPVKTCAKKAGIEVLQPEDINKEYPDIDHDFLVVVAYGQILKEEILNAPNIAPVNLHPSLLPRWRGPSPMKSAILAGDTETGVTIQRIVKKLDSGPILSQVITPIEEGETIRSLQTRLEKAGASLLLDTLNKPLEEKPQDEERVTLCYKLKRSMGNVDPQKMTAEEIDRHVRALVPWPGVRTTIENQEVKLLETSLIPTEKSIPLQCTDADVHIVMLQPSGKKPMSGQAWQRGRN